MRLVALGDDGDTPLHMEPEQDLGIYCFLLLCTGTLLLCTNKGTHTHTLTCAGLRLCLLPISTTTGSSSSLCGSVSPLNLRQTEPTLRGETHDTLELGFHHHGTFPEGSGLQSKMETCDACHLLTIIVLNSYFQFTRKSRIVVFIHAFSPIT